MFCNKEKKTNINHRSEIKNKTPTFLFHSDRKVKIDLIKNLQIWKKIERDKKIERKRN